MEKQELLAEFVGILLGDGNLHKSSNCITIVGSLEDYEYFENRLIPLINQLFDISPSLKRRKDRNAYYVYFNSKKVMDYLTKEIGLVRGNKINAKIPNFVLEDKKLATHFLRGLFDTDGCLKFSKQTKKLHYYPRIQFCFKKTDFSKKVFEVIENLEFNVAKWSEKRGIFELDYCHISGRENVEKWMDLIGSNNPVQKTKYLFWKKQGFYETKSSLSQRQKALTLNMGY